jgi:CPA1 family monovalent cation:H+ antiporter
VDEDTASLYRQLFEMRLDRVRAVLDDTGDGTAADGTGDGAAADGAASYHDLRAELLRAQRDKLADLYAKGKITDDIRRSISRTLDLQEPRPFQ